MVYNLKQIRRGCFETNSSSMHSLAISKGDFDDEHFTHEEMLKSLFPREDGVLYIRKDCYFGRSPFRVICDFVDKFEYAYASFTYDEVRKKELLDLIRELVPEVTEIKEPEFSGTDEQYLIRWMSKYNFSLREFLTNKRYIVIQDGDEYCYFNKLKDSGIIDEDYFDGDATELCYKCKHEYGCFAKHHDTTYCHGEHFEEKCEEEE